VKQFVSFFKISVVQPTWGEADGFLSQKTNNLSLTIVALGSTEPAMKFLFLGGICTRGGELNGFPEEFSSFEHCVLMLFLFRFITVPETLLKRRKRTEIQKAESRKRKEALLKKRLNNKKVAFTRAEQYVKEYRDAELAEIKLRREAKKNNSFYIPPESKIAFVVRIKGINALPPKVRKITHLLRLRQIHNGVFVKINKATMNMIRLIEPYVTFGYPTLKTVRDLVYKRGFVKINKQRIPLTNNDLVEANLGKYGIICVEDLIHELYTAGPHFKEVSNFLWPFKLNSPRGGLVKKRIHYNEGGDFGNREELINDFVKRIL
jgi:large subunit ribosomal protein L7e